MRTLLENAYGDAQLNLIEDPMPTTYEELREIYADGYCAGVWAAIEIISKDPAYKDAVELIEWKIGIKKD